jgi:UDP-glucuronate decarboxylase
MRAEFWPDPESASTPRFPRGGDGGDTCPYQHDAPASELTAFLHLLADASRWYSTRFEKLRCKAEIRVPSSKCRACRLIFAQTAIFRGSPFFCGSRNETDFSMATVLVTGGAGFLGSHLCDRLVERGEDVICLDNFFTGRKENIRHLLNHERFELVRHDIVHPFYLEVDRIFNLACPASPEAYQYNPIKTIKTSTVGMVNVMGLAKRCGARILHASTSEVYGDPQVHPQTEEYWGHVNPIGPRSCYDEGKRIAESLMMNYHHAHGVAIRIIRIFNTYGPRMDPNDGRVISNFITQAIRGDDITVYGAGTQTRSFCYCSDLIEGMLRLMDQDDHTGPINIGNPVENTMLELAEAIIAATGSTSKIVNMPLPKDDPQRRCPDITKAREILKWEPKVVLKEGLQQTIDWYRKEIG